MTTHGTERTGFTPARGNRIVALCDFRRHPSAANREPLARATARDRLRSMSRLGSVSRVAAAFLLVFAAWGALRYGGIRSFTLVAALGAVVVTLRPGIRRWKLWVRRRRQRSRVRLWDYESYASATPTRNREWLLERLRRELDEREEFEPRIDDFPEGRGLTVVHTGSHNLFVRFTDDDRVVITGESGRLSALVSVADSVADLSFEPTDSNPMLRSPRLSGGTRLAVYLVIAFLLIASVNVGTRAAYPADTYNSAERTFLVGIDARGDVDPTASSTEVRLSKAAFLIEVLDEEAVEIYWERNATTDMIRHARQAVDVAADARALLETIEAESTDPSDARRVRRLRSELRTAEANVSRAIEEQIRRVDMDERRADRLRSLRGDLRASANSSSTDEARFAPAARSKVVVGGDEIRRRFRDEGIGQRASSALPTAFRLERVYPTMEARARSTISR